MLLAMGTLIIVYTYLKENGDIGHNNSKFDLYEKENILRSDDKINLEQRLQKKFRNKLEKVHNAINKPVNENLNKAKEETYYEADDDIEQNILDEKEGKELFDEEETKNKGQEDLDSSLDNNKGPMTFKGKFLRSSWKWPGYHGIRDCDRSPECETKGRSRGDEACLEGLQKLCLGQRSSETNIKVGTKLVQLGIDHCRQPGHLVHNELEGN